MNPPAQDALPPARSAADVATADHFLELLRAGTDARHDKVRRLRGAVRADRYENALKLSVAVDRVFRDLGR